MNEISGDGSEGNRAQGRQKETIALPVEGFALLIRSVAQAIINELDKPAARINPAFLHHEVGVLDELVGKFENLHRKEQKGQEG